MNIQKCRINKEKAFRKEYKQLYSQILDYMNDGYSEYSFKMKGTRAETVAILSLLSRFNWLGGDFMDDWGMDERLSNK